MKFEKSTYQKRADAHMSSWQDEADEALGKSSKELGVYNREIIEKRLKDLFEKVIRIKELEFINELKEKNNEAGVYLVGGTVRDAVVGKESKDIDLVINKVDPVELVDLLLKHGKVTFDRRPGLDISILNREEKSDLIKNVYGIIKFNPYNSELKELIDIAFPREDDYSKSGQAGIRGIKRDIETHADPDLNIGEDLERRDFTINAMSINLVNGEIIDPYDGIDDLARGEIRAVGNAEDRILKEDMSRGLRAIRFACVFGAQLEDSTKKAVKKIFLPSDVDARDIYKNDQEILNQVLAYEKEVREIFGIKGDRLPRCLQVFWDKERGKPRMAIAREVMSKEILKAINADPKNFIELMDALGGLEVLLPELARLKGLDQPREFHMEGDVHNHTVAVLDKLPRNASLRLKLAGLFHDVGKAETGGVGSKGKVSFYGHDAEGAEIFEKVGKRFHMERKLIDDVKWLIKKHMFPSHGDIERISASKLEARFIANGELGKDLINLAQADALGSRVKGENMKIKNIEKLIKRLEAIKREIGTKKEKTFLINGKDVLALGFEQGKMVGMVLKKVRDAQLEGNIKTREEAMELIKIIKQNI